MEGKIDPPTPSRDPCSRGFALDAKERDWGRLERALLEMEKKLAGVIS